MRRYGFDNFVGCLYFFFDGRQFAIDDDFLVCGLDCSTPSVGGLLTGADFAGGMKVSRLHWQVRGASSCDDQACADTSVARGVQN